MHAKANSSRVTITVLRKRLFARKRSCDAFRNCTILMSHDYKSIRSKNRTSRYLYSVCIYFVLSCRYFIVIKRKQSIQAQLSTFLRYPGSPSGTTRDRFLFRFAKFVILRTKNKIGGERYDCDGFWDPPNEVDPGRHRAVHGDDFIVKLRSCEEM